MNVFHVITIFALEVIERRSVTHNYCLSLWDFTHNAEEVKHRVCLHYAWSHYWVQRALAAFSPGELLAGEGPPSLFFGIRKEEDLRFWQSSGCYSALLIATSETFGKAFTVFTLCFLICKMDTVLASTSPVAWEDCCQESAGSPCQPSLSCQGCCCNKEMRRPSRQLTHALFPLFKEQNCILKCEKSILGLWDKNPD